MIKFKKITNEAEFNFVIEKLKDISRQQHFTANTEYFENKSLWENLFICPNGGCRYRTLYYNQYLQHVEQGYHVTDPRKGLNVPIKKIKAIVEEEDEIEQ